MVPSAFVVTIIDPKKDQKAAAEVLDREAGASQNGGPRPAGLRPRR
ncbi:hypothetical protein KGA65_02480 [Ideonella sp. B7]|nr:hypothetical protein [Ideonella benzenivorans]MCA6215401.1 hypothetical protein [Ideonella benzenivorans]